jgi:putative hydrolase of the HAD superfamily
MTIPITPLAVLFDADGVIQQPPLQWQARLASLAGASDRAEEFLAEVFAAEGPCLRGQGDFQACMQSVLDRWNSRIALQDVLSIWREVLVDQEALAVVDELRAAKIQCYLTTNQNALRARHMSETLGYARRFDREFYSCELGHAKPTAAFFQAVLDAIALPPSRVLFIDDHAGNVEGARAMGLQAALFEPSSGAAMLRTCIQSFGVRSR